jgi:predicted ATPase/class 3 adenylate cyclase/DNA-binding winged helix-turn-helix (wHTH) protein
VPDRSPLALLVLGSLEAVREGAPLRLGSRQERQVLAVLAVRANEVVSTDRLFDVLWGDAPPPTASHTLQAVVSRLRKALGPDRVETVKPGYRLRVDATELDSLRFEELVRAGLGADRPDAAAVAFEGALGMWQGRPYAEFADEEFASAEVARLDELRMSAIEEHAQAVVDLGRPGEVIGELEAEIEAEPFRERLRAVFMLALARAGRPVEALRAFDAYRGFLADEVGVVPSAALQELNDDILRQHPDAGWERTARSGAAPRELPTGTVTFLFTDLEGSTRLWQEHPDTMGEALTRHDAILRDAVASHNGSVVKTTGDGVHAVFADARDAIDAAIAAQGALLAEPWNETGVLRVRIGVHTGSAERRGNDYDGPAVNQAARLMGIAHGGQIICSGVVADLIDGHVDLTDLGPHRLRDVESALRVFQILAPGLETQFPPLSSLDAHRSNLPQEMGSFVGRIDDVTAMMKAFAQARVVSVVGMGGVGKTRLALRVGTKLLPEFPDGVWWGDLAGVRDPDAIPEAVAAAVGYAPSQGVSMIDGLTAFFRHKQLLLVLDNCEHLLGGAAAFVRTISAEASQLSVLATSREALSIQGEQIYLLPPLDLPLDTSPFEVEESEAGALFATRAREGRPSFTVTAENAAAIAELCARLDANALAIELAAARTTVMSPSEILDRLEQRFRLLTLRGRAAPERHQSLHAAIDWSYELLDTPEQALLQRLSVFVGDFDLDAATAMAADVGLDEFDTVDRLASLIAKSLVEYSDTTTVSRYRLLETIREYAAERLEAAANTASARVAHAAHYLTAGRDLFAALDTPGDFEALEQLRNDTPNLAAGLRYLIASDRVADVLGFFADAGSLDTGIMPFNLQDELGRVADEALREHGTSRMPGYVAAQLYSGMRGFVLGDWDRQQRAVSAANAVDPSSPLISGMALGAAALHGDLAGGISIGLAGVERMRRVGDPRSLSYLLSQLSLCELGVDPVRSLAHAEEAVEVARACAATSALVLPLCQLSIVLEVTRSDPERALAAAEESIRLDRSHRRVWSTLSQGSAAKLRVKRGEVATGLRLWSEALHRLDWSGEVGPLTMQLPALADVIAEIDAPFALELAAIAGSGVIAPYAIFDILEGFERLPFVINEFGPDAVEAARSRAGGMSYEHAIAYVFDGIDRLIAQTAPGEPEATSSSSTS